MELTDKNVGITEAKKYDLLTKDELREVVIETKQMFGFDCRLRQLQSIKAIMDNQSVLAELPTSYGKTIIAVYLALLSKKSNNKIVLLVPLKALTNEHYATFTTYNLKVALFDSDHDTDLTTTSLGDVNIFTYEKFDSIMRKQANYWLLKQISYVCIDEIHNINKAKSGRGRGYAIESSLTKVKMANPDIKFLGLSATLGDESPLLKFLNMKLVKADSSERPVPLEIQFKHVEKDELEGQLQDDLVDGMNSLIFTSARKTTENLAYRQNGKPAPLTELISNGIGYHHAGINEEDTETRELVNNKKLVEDAYRKGLITYLYATSTLAAGVNLPAKRVIIYNTVRYSTLHGETPIDASELLQMAGRAGRNPAIDKIAYCSMYIPSKFYQEITENLHPADIHSNLEDDDCLIMFVLEMVAEGFADNVVDLITKCFNNTMIKPDSKRIGDALSWLIEYRLVYKNEQKLTASFVGRMCIMLYIDPKTAIHLRDCRIETDNLPLKFMNILNCSEFAETVTVRKEDETNINYVSLYLKNKDVDISKMKYAPNLCKAFALLFKQEVINFVKDNLHMKEPRIYWSASDNFILKKASERIFMAGSIIGHETIKKECRFLGKVVSVGTFDKDLAMLMQIPSIGEKRLYFLQKNGIKKIQDFINTEDSKLMSYMGRITIDSIRRMKENAKLILDGKEPIGRDN